MARGGWSSRLIPAASAFLAALFRRRDNPRNTTFMAWNLMHMARMLKDAGGIPAHGNQKSAWDKGERFDCPNPEYR